MNDEQQDDEPEGPRCTESLWGFSCAYELGHECSHWTITDWGEYTWTTEGERRRRSAFDNSKQKLQELISALELEGEPEGANDVKTMLVELEALFPMYAEAKP